MTLRDLLEQAVEVDPTRPYLFFRDDIVSIGALLQYVDNLASALHEFGVRQGDQVALLLPNRPEFLYSWFALASLGAVTVPVNPAFTRRELRQILKHSDAIGLITDDQCVEVAAEVRPDTLIRWIVTADTAKAGRYALRDLLDCVTVRPPLVARNDDAVAALMYTSGTTGTPRGVLKTHRSYTRVAQEVSRWLMASSNDRFFTCLPLFHTSAQVCAVLPSLACHGSLVLGERFSASHFWEVLTASSATIFNYIGTMLAILAKTQPSPAERTHRVRVAMGAGATADLERICKERFGVPLVEGYGLTEASGVAVRPLSAGGPPGSVGWPAPYCDVRIVDEEGRDCPPHAIGEIIVSQSEVLMVGYYKDPAATAAAMQDGWFFTGDLGWRDEHRVLYFAGRKKELIRHRGENLSPREVETILLSHPAVAEVAVVGRSSKLADQDVCAVVVPSAGAHVSADELRDFCRTRLAPFKVPTIIEFRTALPKTSTQKILRERLRRPGSPALTDDHA